MLSYLEFAVIEFAQDVEERLVGKWSPATCRPTWFWQPGNAKQEETMSNISEEELADARGDDAHAATPGGHVWNHNKHPTPI